MNNILFTDSERNVVKSGTQYYTYVKTGDPVTLPCIATHPNVIVNVMHIGRNKVAKHL